MKAILAGLRKGSLFGAALLLGVIIAGNAHAGATFKIDDTKWLSIGVGLRTSFSAVEDTAGNSSDKWSTDFDLNNIRLYTNGQIHKYIKFEFNTDCSDCSDGGDLIVLDAIGKFEFNDIFNVWVGRQLVPADRAELDGPFYHNTFELNKTPFYPSDFGNFDAGKFGRDDGINLWGALTPDKRLTYVAGIFDGLDGKANTDDNLLYAGRISYNFLNVEENPGYYTSSTYYGKAGDILTLAVAAQYQEDGAGLKVTTAAPGERPADFFGTSVDVLYETVLGNAGVVTVEGEYKYFNLTHLTAVTQADASGTCFCLFEGDAYTGTALYLFPEKVWIGQFQPYVRYTKNEPDNSKDREETEVGVNYVIDGHNARISLMYQYGDIATKGRDYSTGTGGEHVHAIKMGIQLQI